MARERLSEEQIQAIRAERAQATQVIEALAKVLAVPGVTTSHPQLVPYMQVLLGNQQVPKLTWFSAIRFQGYDAVLAARYPGAESVAIAMRDAARKGGYAPAERLEWADFRAAVARGLTHDEWEAHMKVLPELPKRERKVSPAAAAATSLTELLQAQQNRAEEEDDEERDPLMPAQQIRLTLAGAEPAKTPAVAPVASLPPLDISTLMQSLGGPAVTPAPVAAPMVTPAMPDLSGILKAAPDGSNSLKIALDGALLAKKITEEDHALFSGFIEKNPEAVKTLLKARGI